jgi:polyketide cyclase/dehydrase/lipid transport protein
MSVQRRVKCSPAQVFDVLNDGWTYALWVVGASRMRDVDQGWPATGTKLHHSFGVWPLLINDSTKVLEIEPGKRLLLEARGWPIGEAKVEITIEPDGNGALISIAEDASSGPARLVPEQIRQPVIDFRNQETLRRLAYVVEGRHDNQADISERSGSAEI